MSERRLAYRTCPLCEATCGLEVTLGPTGVERIRGDAADVFSHGYVCPKGASIKDLHHDPDRLRQPHVRRPDGSHEAVGWDEALAVVERLLVPILETHGPDSIGAYVGNPMGTQPRRQPLPPRLPQDARHAVALHGRHDRPAAEVPRERPALRLAVHRRDPRRRSHLASPDPRSQPSRLERQPHRRSRHARPVASDPARAAGRWSSSTRVRTRTAREADEHHFIRPGTDALLLAAMAHTLFDEELVRLRGLEAHVAGIAEVRAFAETFAPERVAPACGIEADADPTARTRARRRRDGGGLRPDRDDAAGIRHGGELARRRAERAHREPRQARRRDVHDPRCRGTDVHRRAGPRAGCVDGAVAQPGTRSAGGARRTAAGLPRGGDRRPGRGSAARTRDILGQPGAQQSERAAVGVCAPPAGVPRLRRLLSQRDDETGRRDPAAALSARARALRPGRLPDRRA